MGELVDVAMAFLERCEQHTALRTLVADFKVTLGSFGFQYFMMTRLPAIGEDAEPYVIAHTWPKEWLDQYRSEAYFWHDPVSHFALTRARPFSWAEAVAGSTKTRIAGKIFSEAKSVGLADGFGFPMGDASSVQAVVSLASDRPVDLDFVARKMLHLICLHVEMQAAEILDRDKAKVETLTEREREVLRWIANGKSQWEASVILSVSKDTVDMHLRHARSKLRATTTTHAIARALHSRQIIL
jgi:LuxR family quorum sensing-dependent transcriptional regulator